MLYDFKCEDGHVTEQFVNSDERQSPCRECGKPATRELCAPTVHLDPISGDFPGATIAWDKKRQQRIKLEKKAMDNNGPDAAWDLSKQA